MNWKKYVIYDFMEWLKDTENLQGNIQVIEVQDMQEKIETYVTACYYDYQDTKEYENFTLEDMEKFLKSVFV